MGRWGVVEVLQNLDPFRVSLFRQLFLFVWWLYRQRIWWRIAGTESSASPTMVYGWDQTPQSSQLIGTSGLLVLLRVIGTCPGMSLSSTSRAARHSRMMRRSDMWTLWNIWLMQHWAWIALLASRALCWGCMHDLAKWAGSTNTCFRYAKNVQKCSILLAHETIRVKSHDAYTYSCCVPILQNLRSASCIKCMYATVAYPTVAEPTTTENRA